MTVRDGAAGRINLTKATFVAVFVGTFVLAGPLTLTMRQYRLSPLVVLVLPLILKRGISADKVFCAVLALISTVVASGIINGSDWLRIVVFLRSPLIALVAYRLVDAYATPENMPFVIRSCVAIASIQTPLILLERALYSVLPMGRLA